MKYLLNWVIYLRSVWAAKWCSLRGGKAMTPEALAYCEKQTQRISELEQQVAELVAALRLAENYLLPRVGNSPTSHGCSVVLPAIRVALANVKQP